MGKQVVEDKQICVPGDVLALGMDFLPSYGTYRDGEKIIAQRLGLVSTEGKAIRIIPLTGRYIPKRGDVIIGQIVDFNVYGWRVETRSAYSAMLNVKDATAEFIQRGADLSQYFNLDDYIVTKIISVNNQMLVDLTMKGRGLRKLEGGRIMEINTNKVPRVIGKNGSMVSMIKQATGCQIIVGQNGLIWIDGEPEKELIAVEAIQKIERECHMSGLTETMRSYLEGRTDTKIQMQTQQGEEQ